MSIFASFDVFYYMDSKKFKLIYNFIYYVHNYHYNIFYLNLFLSS